MLQNGLIHLYPWVEAFQVHPPSADPHQNHTTPDPAGKTPEAKEGVPGLAYYNR